MGKLEIANKGTVFLDDVDSLDTNMQAKLLRVIQQKELERLGSNKIIRLDVRFVAASNQDLQGLISAGRFREDLYYRLNVFPVRIPPLRKRKSDIPLLLDHFLVLYGRRTGKETKRFTKKAVDVLMGYDWPGNVRELENLVERLCTIIPKPFIGVEDLSLTNTSFTKAENMNLKEAVGNFERNYIRDVLESVGWSRKEASEILGIHRNTLAAKIIELGIME
jgi:DNA-binding NtrC family response regulator